MGRMHSGILREIVFFPYNFAYAAISPLRTALLRHIKVISAIRKWLSLPPTQILLDEPQNRITSHGELHIL